MNFDYCRGIKYKIVKGDTLYSISRKFRIPLVVLMKANPYADVYNLQIGEELCIPVKKGGQIPCDMRPDMKPDCRPDMKPDWKPDMKPDWNPDMKPDMKPDWKPDWKPEWNKPCMNHPCMECMMRDGFAEMDGIEPME